MITKLTISITSITDNYRDMLIDIETSDGKNPMKQETMWVLDHCRRLLLESATPVPHHVTDSTPGQ